MLGWWCFAQAVEGSMGLHAMLSWAQARWGAVTCEPAYHLVSLGNMLTRKPQMCLHASAYKYRLD